MKTPQADMRGRLPDITLMLLRVVTGAFLVHGTQDNVFSAERMREFVGFLAQHGFAWPHLMAPLSVHAQFLCGALLVLGLLTRWAGLVVAINFMVAVMMVHWHQDFRGWWPALVLVLLGLHFAAQGGGRYALDSVLAARHRGKRDKRDKRG
jgi:putative oxidoreductase